MITVIMDNRSNFGYSFLYMDVDGSRAQAARELYMENYNAVRLNVIVLDTHK